MSRAIAVSGVHHAQLDKSQHKCCMPHNHKQDVAAEVIFHACTSCDCKRSLQQCCAGWQQPLKAAVGLFAATHAVQHSEDAARVTVREQQAGNSAAYIHVRDIAHLRAQRFERVHMQGKTHPQGHRPESAQLSGLPQEETPTKAHTRGSESRGHTLNMTWLIMEGGQSPK